MHFLYLHRLACNIIIELKIVKNLWAKLPMVHKSNFGAVYVPTQLLHRIAWKERTFVIIQTLNYHKNLLVISIRIHITIDFAYNHGRKWNGELSYKYWFCIKALKTTARKWNGERFTTTVKTNVGLPMLRCWYEYTVIWKIV